MAQKQNLLPPVKVAILIDGGFFLKRFNALYNKDRSMTPDQVAAHLYTMAHKHVGDNNTLYRIFYYDCYPCDKKFHNPISKQSIDLKKTEEYKFKMSFYEELKRKRKVALRLGELSDAKNWKIKPDKLQLLLKGEINFSDIKPEDVMVEVKQKGIDMKIGVDIASLSLKKFVDTIVLFSGDSDFVPAAKLARREGVDFILDPMHANVKPSLFEHIDGMKCTSPFNESKKKHNKKTKIVTKK